jgi:hypothetical protein
MTPSVNALILQLFKKDQNKKLKRPITCFQSSKHFPPDVHLSSTALNSSNLTGLVMHPSIPASMHFSLILAIERLVIMPITYHELPREFSHLPSNSTSSSSFTGLLI